MFCPLKFNNITPTIKKSFSKETVEVLLKCDTKKCAWYCQYTNGEGECAIRSLPGLFDGLDSIATQIAKK